MVSGKHPGTQDAQANSREEEIQAVKAKAETQTPRKGHVLDPELLLRQPPWRAEGLFADTDLNASQWGWALPPAKVIFERSAGRDAVQEMSGSTCHEVGNFCYNSAALSAVPVSTNLHFFPHFSELPIRVKSIHDSRLWMLQALFLSMFSSSVCVFSHVLLLLSFPGLWEKAKWAVMWVDQCRGPPLRMSPSLFPPSAPRVEDETELQSPSLLTFWWRVGIQ